MYRQQNIYIEMHFKAFRSVYVKNGLLVPINVVGRGITVSFFSLELIFPHA